MKKIKFFNLDCHISVIADLKTIFEDLGHSVTSWSISGHNWIFDRAPNSLDVINPQNWKSLDDNMCERFYLRYKDELSIYDAFICTYPPAFSMLYEKFNKPILCHIPIRYEVPFSNNKELWEKFNLFLKKNIDNKLLIPVANSMYDKKYFEFFVDRNCDYIPNLCEYTNTKWNPQRDEFLQYGFTNLNLGSNIIHKDSLGKYKWDEITKFKGIILIPYNVSTMSLFEYYTSNIPLFCPSKKLMNELYTKSLVLSQLTWNQTFSLPPSSVIDCLRTNDPNDYIKFEIISEWINYSDFYNEEWLPYITYFDTFEELKDKLQNVNLFEISKKMETYNQQRKNKVYDFWKTTIEKL